MYLVLPCVLRVLRVTLHGTHTQGTLIAWGRRGQRQSENLFGMAGRALLVELRCM